MADEEEYKFNDPDATPAEWDPVTEADTEVSPEVVNHAHGYAESIASSIGEHSQVIRKGLIVIFVLIFSIMLYKVVRDMYAKKQNQPMVVSEQPAKATIPVATLPQPVAVTAPVSMPAEWTQKLSSFEITQQTMQSALSSMTENVSGVELRVNEINANVSTLTQTLDALQAKIAVQSELIEKLLAAHKKTQIAKSKHRNKSVHPSLTYYVQAVIPGRAWLIATNGATLTVRVGTLINGYGLVKLIDSTQGRVLTSSGKVIRFSQDDS